MQTITTSDQETIDGWDQYYIYSQRYVLFTNSFYLALNYTDTFAKKEGLRELDEQQKHNNRFIATLGSSFIFNTVKNVQLNLQSWFPFPVNYEIIYIRSDEYLLLMKQPEYPCVTDRAP